jgi:ABC-2 type transport system ATP-binding protein
MTVFVTTHYMDEAEYCDRLGLIYRGELIALGTPDELKTGRMTEEIVEISCEHPHEAMELIEPLAGVRQVSLFGRGLHIVTDQADRVMPLVRETLATAGCTASAPEIITPSLEDVFVSLIEARDRQEPADRGTTP